MLTALFHDIGKARTTTIDENETIHSIGHENCITFVLQALKRLDVATDTMRYVCNMVQYHMRPNALVAQQSTQKAYNRLFSKSIHPYDFLLFSKVEYLGSTRRSGYEEIEKVLYQRYEKYLELNL